MYETRREAPSRFEGYKWAINAIDGKSSKLQMEMHSAVCRTCYQLEKHRRVAASYIELMTLAGNIGGRMISNFLHRAVPHSATRCHC